MSNASYARALAMVNDPSIPIDLTGLSSDQRALVMIHRRDCEIDMTGLTPYDRARVMLLSCDLPGARFYGPFYFPAPVFDLPVAMLFICTVY